MAAIAITGDEPRFLEMAISSFEDLITKLRETWSLSSVDSHDETVYRPDVKTLPYLELLQSDIRGETSTIGHVAVYLSAHRRYPEWGPKVGYHYISDENFISR